MTWKYLDNQFEVTTKKSYKKALKLSNFHDAALQTQVITTPGLQPLLDRYHPIHLDYVDQYTKWRSAGGKQEGQTLNLEQQLAIALGQIDVWEPQILVLYPRNTPRFKEIFPDGRKPFRQSGLDDRINAFKTLSDNIGGDAALAAVKAQVDATYATLDNARDTQEGAKTTKKGGSQQVDIARLAAMNMQYRNMAFVLDNFFDNREDMCNKIFDLQTLRESDQSIFTGTLEAQEVEQVLVHTFLSDDELRLKIDTNGPVSFYLASTPGGTDSNPITLSTAAEITSSIAAFGLKDMAGHRYLTAVNNTQVITKYRVMLL